MESGQPRASLRESNESRGADMEGSPSGIEERNDYTDQITSQPTNPLPLPIPPWEQPEADRDLIT